MTSSQLRLRVFAGPNGSGKSTVIQEFREYEASGRPLDVGVYINADDIAKALRAGNFTFAAYQLEPALPEITGFAQTSGLLREPFDLAALEAAISLNGSQVIVHLPAYLDYIAQLIARFLREALLAAKRRFSFETVFSHESNLDIMERAAAAGYKVYLYFVSTEAPEINQYRVELRVRQGGHPVPPQLISERYYRSLGLLYRAAGIAYQAFFFDNSGAKTQLIAHFKRTETGLQWDPLPPGPVSNWFKRYYLDIARKAGTELPPENI